MNKINELDNINACTDNYASQKERMRELSIVDLCRAIDLINTMNNMININNKIQDDERRAVVEDVLQPLYAAMMDLPQYDFACPHCDENF